ncbi:MAG: zinc-binding alcohol dehydrogenase family protein [Rhodospirillales bacterium]|jgi:NADPH:quinone reductase-like Zn-dependent oxidoreductase|nr:zinc-binding alcohol dehydrogenase family protein [Rhodospirillales bacterium]
MKAIRVHQKSKSSDNLKFELTNLDTPEIKDGGCLIRIEASCINPSDVKALLGKMPNLVWPRTPGRDYAGTVIEGPSELIGKEVWGSGGDLGMSRDGAHAEFTIVDAAGVREKPANLSMTEAGSVGVAWTCAWLGMTRSNVTSGETVAVLGANGKVGEASIQIATAAGSRVIAVERSRDEYNGHATGPVDVVNLSKESDLRQAILDRTDGNGADIIMNTVGSPYFEAACYSLNKEGRQIILSTKQEECSINLKTFYRGNYHMVGVSNMDHHHILSGDLMEKMRSGFESGSYKPYPIKEENVYTLENAGEAYGMVLKGECRDRIVINPQG